MTSGAVVVGADPVPDPGLRPSCCCRPAVEAHPASRAAAAKPTIARRPAVSANDCDYSRSTPSVRMKTEARRAVGRRAGHKRLRLGFTTDSRLSTVRLSKFRGGHPRPQTIAVKRPVYRGRAATLLAWLGSGSAMSRRRRACTPPRRRAPLIPRPATASTPTRCAGSSRPPGNSATSRTPSRAACARHARTWSRWSSRTSRTRCSRRSCAAPSAY